MGLFTRRRGEAMPDRFYELAEYNGRKGKYVFTESHMTRMAELQLDFDIWRAESTRRSPFAAWTLVPCGLCHHTWSAADPGVTIVGERPIWRCSDPVSCDMRQQEG